MAKRCCNSHFLGSQPHRPEQCTKHQPNCMALSQHCYNTHLKVRTKHFTFPFQTEMDQDGRSFQTQILSTGSFKVLWIGNYRWCCLIITNCFATCLDLIFRYINLYQRLWHTESVHSHCSGNLLCMRNVFSATKMCLHVISEKAKVYINPAICCNICTPLSQFGGYFLRDFRGCRDEWSNI